jgi:hypothetical protein
MGLTIRPADLSADRSLLIDALRRYLTPFSDDDRFDWLYRANPHGAAHAWIGRDDSSGEVVAVASAFPRRLYRGGGEAAGWVLGDFCVDDRHRALGPALQLQRACIAGLESAGADAWYDFPSASMMAVYRRLAIPPTARMIRFAKPLRLDRWVAERVPFRPLADRLARAGNFLLQWGLPGRDPGSGRTIGRHDASFDSEFTDFAARIGSSAGTCVQRTAAYLNWRYRDCPSGAYETLVARESGRIAGYAVLAQRESEATVVDLFGAPPAAASALLGTAARVAAQRGVQTLSMPMLEGDPRTGLARALGFRAREAVPVVLVEREPRTSASEAGGFAGWHLMHGDRDI